MARTYKPKKSARKAKRVRKRTKSPWAKIFAMPGTAPGKGETPGAWRTRRKTKRKMYK